MPFSPMPMLVNANFSSLKKLSKKSLSQTNCDNIALKNSQLSQKNRIHWSRSLSHLACTSIIVKCLQCDVIAIPD